MTRLEKWAFFVWQILMPIAFFFSALCMSFIFPISPTFFAKISNAGSYLIYGLIASGFMVSVFLMWSGLITAWSFVFRTYVPLDRQRAILRAKLHDRAPALQISEYLIRRSTM